MPQLDRFLSVLVSNRAESVRLVEGQMALLEVNGTAKPMTKQPLTASQLVGLLREIAPPDAAAQLAAGQDATFHYASADGAFVATARQQGGAWHATLKVDAEGDARLTGAHAAIAPGSVTAATNARLASLTPAGGSAAHAGNGNGKHTGAVRVVHDPAREAAAKATIEALLTLMVEKKASDLHIRVGEPPILRTSGEMVRIEGKATLENAE